MITNPTTSNGITKPVLKAHEGSPQMAAHQQNVAASTKLNNLNKVVKGGKKRSRGRRVSIGGAPIEVTTITPKYTSTSSGNQDPVTQQKIQAGMSNQSYVQSQGDKVNTVAVPKGGSKRRRTKKTQRTRKIRRTRKRKTRKSNKK